MAQSALIYQELPRDFIQDYFCRSCGEYDRHSLSHYCDICVDRYEWVRRVLQRGEPEEDLSEIISSQAEVSVDDLCTNSFLVEDVCLEEPTCEQEEVLLEIALNMVEGYATSADYCARCDWWGHPPCVDYCWTCQL